jgi:uncharacterized coiled-coil DUF342 family protein
MESLQQLETNLKRLLEQYYELQDKYDRLQEQVVQQREEIIRTHTELKQLSHDYTRLHTAHTILLGNEAEDEDRLKTKQRLTNIILQIDKALEILKQ